MDPESAAMWEELDRLELEETPIHRAYEDGEED